MKPNILFNVIAFFSYKKISQNISIIHYSYIFIYLIKYYKFFFNL